MPASLSIPTPPITPPKNRYVLVAPFWAVVAIKFMKNPNRKGAPKYQLRECFFQHENDAKKFSVFAHAQGFLPHVQIFDEARILRDCESTRAAPENPVKAMEEARAKHEENMRNAEKEEAAKP